MSKSKPAREASETLFEQLESLIPRLAAETAPGLHPDIVSLALTNVLGAIDHVGSARRQASPLWRR